MISFFLFIALWIFMTMLSNPEPVPLKTIEINTNLAVSEEKITGKNGGHNDGTIYQKYDLNDDELKEIIASVETNPHWQKGALSEELKKEIATAQKNEMLDIDNGYFFFKDRHAEASGDIYRYDEEVVNGRFSYNYMIAALDVENKKLYYYQLDT